MVRLNKTSLQENKVKILHNQLNKVLGDMSQKDINTFLNSLLGTEERLMLAKRLAVVVMIEEGYSDYRIADILKLSATTVKKIKEKNGKSTYRDLAKSIKSNTAVYDTILKVVESLLTVGGIMPMRSGLDRYKYLNRKSD